MLDENSAKALAKQSANMSGKRQLLYVSNDREYMHGPDGTLQYLRNMGIKKQYKFVGYVYPEGQEPKE